MRKMSVYFFFEQAKMRYINKKFWSLAQWVPKETKEGYKIVQIKTTKYMKDNKSANP